MAGTLEGGKKAAETRGHEGMGDMGRQGAETLNADQQKKSAAAQKAADTRKKEDPQAFQKMGEKGGSQTQGTINEEQE